MFLSHENQPTIVTTKKLRRVFKDCDSIRFIYSDNNNCEWKFPSEDLDEEFKRIKRILKF